jgi:hypothetical protein
MVLGLGALSTGSGAVFSSAALTSTTQTASTLEVYSVAELNVTRGADQISAPLKRKRTYDYDGSYTINEREDLPAAYVDDGSTQGGNLNVQVATRNDAQTKEFPYLLEVTNNGSSAVEIGIGFDKFGSNVGSSKPITENKVIDTYDFKTNKARSSYGASDDVDISANSVQADKKSPANYEEIPTGQSLAVDLDVDPVTGIVGEINDATSPNNTFNNSNTDDVTLVDRITFGTKNDS